MDLVEYQSQKQERHFWELARIKFIKTLLKHYINDGISLSVADIGCGDCYAIAALKTSFPFRQIWAKDPNLKEPILSELKRKYPEIVFENSTADSDLALMPGSDLCLMLDVLEHIDHDHDFLVSINRKLNDNGILLITVPAYNSLFSSHDVFLKHYRRYNRRKLCKHLTDADFTVLNSGYFFFSLLLIRFLQKVFHVQDHNDVGRGGTSCFNTLFAGILFFDARIGLLLNHIKIRLPGLSCWAVAQKNNTAESKS